jgi:hypothetical protein
MFEPSSTQFVRAEKKHRFRYSLPVEVLLYVYLAIMALAGGVLPGSLHDTLLLRGENLPWLFMVGGIAAGGLLVSGAELLCGACWVNARLRNFAQARMWFNVLAITVWVYIVCTILLLRDPFGVTALMLIAVLLSAYHAWSAALCKRLHFILSPQYHTTQLERRLENDRLSAH